MRTDWKKISKEELEKLYYDHKSAVIVGKLFGIASTAVYFKLKKFKIKTISRKLPKPNIENKEFGWYTVIGNAVKKGTYWYFDCKCKCGKINNVNSYDLIMGLSNGCRSCALKRGQTAKENSKCWKGYKEISRWFFNKFVIGAKKREINFSISIEYAWTIFLKQNRRCAISNIKLKLPQRSNNQGTLEATASLDRIDSSKGYIEGNVQWVHKHINIMKGQLDLKSFINYCRLITEYNDDKEYDSNYIKDIENYADNNFLLRPHRHIKSFRK